MYRNYDSKQNLISIHIPKAGGTSFREVLKKWFGRGFVEHYFDEIKNIGPKIIKERKSWLGLIHSPMCIHGHFNRERNFGLEHSYPSINQYVTIVRDPLETQISLFHFTKELIKKEALFKDGKQIDAITDDIDEFIETTNSHFLLHLPKELNKVNFESVLFEKFIHVGVMEDYQISIDIIAQKLGKKKVKVPALNTSTHIARPSESSIKKFKEKSRFEYSIYDFAVKQNFSV